MARPESLVAGNCYFLVGYQDNDLLLPLISTLIYVRAEVDPDNCRYWLFQELTDTESPDDQPEGIGGTLVGFGDDNLYQILDFDGLRRTLSEVATLHPLHPAPSPELAGLGPPADFGELALKVAEFLKTPDYVSVTITVMYTNDGFSLGRGLRNRPETEFEFSFFTHPRRDLDEEPKVRTLFSSIGIEPHTDYLADKGRTQVLGFRAPSEQSALVELSKRVLTEVYDIRARDRLRYHFLRRSDIEPRNLANDA